MNFATLKGLTIPEGEVASISRNGEILWQKQTKKYKTELEYIEVDGTADIDTGINGNNNNLSFDFAFNLLQYKYYGGFFGNYVNENTNCWRFIQTDANNKTGYVNANDKARNACKVNYQLNTICTAHISRATIRIDDKTFAPLIVNGTVNNNTIRLFNQGKGINSSKFRMYYFKISGNDNLVRDFIPVLDWNDRPCMYDKVSGGLFYNKGTGEFLYG